MDIQTEVNNYVGEKRKLVDAITREFRGGSPAKAIARLVVPAFSRDQVTQYLAAVALHDAARKALKEAGLDAAVSVSVTGIDAPREARIALAADPGEHAEHDDLPSRIRAALRDFHVTLDVPDGEHDEVTDALIDEYLLDGEAVRLIRQKARA
ncbi:hypothetical protein [Phytohabitans kaempferiae]|uniref:Uncharacterized protein n=1 Tax=Phytohabitans kaempferiae TaxID=1620943 RepID=A0ABV6MA09_9ACTN